MLNISLFVHSYRFPYGVDSSRYTTCFLFPSLFSRVRLLFRKDCLCSIQICIKGTLQLRHCSFCKRKNKTHAQKRNYLTLSRTLLAWGPLVGVVSCPLSTDILESAAAVAAAAVPGADKPDGALLVLLLSRLILNNPRLAEKSWKIYRKNK